MPFDFSLRSLVVLATAALLILLTACRKDEGGVIRINPKTFNAAQEAAIGRRLIAESWRNENVAIIQADADQFTDGAYFYLRPLLEGLVEQPMVTRRDSFDWEIILVLDQEPHAYTLPGGKMVFHTGLLHKLTNEAECVGLLAREVALAEIGAPMDALDRQVEDNVVLGDMILGNLVPLDHVIEALPHLAYTEEEMQVADSLAARIICASDYEERGLTFAVEHLPAQNNYMLARPAEPNWKSTFNSRVSECPGADSLYQQRYQDVLEAHVPN